MAYTTTDDTMTLAYQIKEKKRKNYRPKMDQLTNDRLKNMLDVGCNTIK